MMAGARLTPVQGAGASAAAKKSQTYHKVTLAEGVDEASVERFAVGGWRVTSGFSNGQIAVNGTRGGAGLCERC